MTAQLTESHVVRVCGGTSFRRGMSYWQTGRVLDAELQRQSSHLLITSSVSGRHYRAYQQSIEVYVTGAGNLVIDGECSCPMMMNCKHVAAALLHVINMGRQQIEIQPRDAVESWLEKLQSTSRKEYKANGESFADTIKFRLVYILFPDQATKNRSIKVKSQKARLLKEGGYGVPKGYALEKINQYYTDNFIAQSDKDIARLLMQNRDYYYAANPDYELVSDLGELALKKMLASGRCHWSDQDTPPLSMGAPRTISFSWEATDGGKTLKHSIDPPPKEIFRLNRLWYLDHNTFQIGELGTPDLDVESAANLLDAPFVPDDKLEEVSRRLIIDVPEYALPTPVEINIEKIKIKGEKPVCHLNLHSLEDTSSIASAPLFHCARLTFGYGPVFLEENSSYLIEKITRGNTLYLIERDIPCETQAMEVLKDLGFHLYNPQKKSEVTKLEWIFQSKSVADSAMQWHVFIETVIPELREQGWQINIDDTFNLRFEESDDWHAELEEDDSDWFSLSLGVELDGEHINLLPALVELLSHRGTPQQLREYLRAKEFVLVQVQDYRWLKLPFERILPIFDALVELYDHQPLDHNGKLALSRHQGVQIHDLLHDPGLRWHGAEELRKLSARLRDFHGIQHVEVPQNFTAQLRPYQQLGLNWTQFLRDFGFNGILADDMGLGKTVQALANLLLEKQNGRMEQPSLVIAPTSLMGNWRRETERFAPELKVLVLHGADRHDHFDEISDNDLILTTYPLLRRDKGKLMEYDFHYLILDEAQAIKNPKAQTTQVTYELKASHRLCLTGTPMENHLGELWSMFHFLMPGFLGNLERFNRLFRNPIERQGDSTRLGQLNRRIEPFLLRRTKDEVASELPPKTEIVRTVSLQGKQRDLYETIRLAMDKKVRQEIKKKGLARSHIMILDALLKLRQTCCDPRLLSLPQASKVQQSAKLALLMEMVPEMLEEGRKILIFSQFTQMLNLIEMEIQALNIDYSKLTGQTRNRDQVIDRFQDGHVPLFLISLKAGGVGLNLTAADTVIHYDPWWNPAVENQATDRAHRIGQDKAVFVYKLITEESVEEKIIALQQKKQALADAIYAGKTSRKVEMFSAEDLSALLKPLGQ